jgi:hypothetical protein
MHALQAEVVLRFSPNHCRVQQEDGTRLEISDWLARLEEGISISEQQGYCVQGAEQVKVRVLALRLPAEAAEQARERVRARAKRNEPRGATGDVATSRMDSPVEHFGGRRLSGRGGVLVVSEPMADRTADQTNETVLAPGAPAQPPR